MFNNLNYVFDAETGDIIPCVAAKNKLETSKTKKKRRHRPKRLSYQQRLTSEIADLTYDKNFIRDSFKYSRVKLLTAVLDTVNLEKQKELDGLYLSNLLICKKMFEDGVINLELVKSERDYLTKMQSEKISEEVLKIIKSILGYIDFYFRGLL